MTHAPDISRDCIGRRRKLRIALPVFVEETAIDSVRVRRDEINTGATLPHVGQKLGDPGRSCGGRTSDPQGRIDRLDRPRGHVVEIKVRLLVGALPKTREIGFIPDLEIPGAYLVATVALLNMVDESRHEVPPARGVRVRG